MGRKEHLSLEGLQKIVALKSTLSTGFLSEELKVAFPNLNIVERPHVVEAKVIDPSWLAGFTSGEGSFMVRTLNSPGRVMNTRVQLEYNLTQHSRDEQLMRKIAEFFGCGSVYLNRNTYVYRVLGFTDIVEKILPLFQQYPVLGVKSQDFKDFMKVVELMKSKKHLTQEGVEQIKEIKAGMNRGRSE